MDKLDAFTGMTECFYLIGFEARRAKGKRQLIVSFWKHAP
jgi:hypothetical protein